MSSKLYESGQELHQKILEGVDTLADNVASTLGPRGRNVVLHQKDANPIITKDGVTVARFVELDDPFQNLGVQVVKQASSQTNNDAGDGTTTATVLARAILSNAQKYLVSGLSPVEIKRGIDAAVVAVCENLTDLARPVMSEEEVAHIATISANGDDNIGKLVATAVDLVGKDGAITIEEARSVETSLDVIEGFRFDSGYVSNQFVTDKRRNVIKYDNALILVTDNKIETVEDLLPTLEVAARESRPLLIVCEDVEGQALAALIMNTVRGSMRVAAVKAPRYGEERRNILKDLAVAVGSKFVSREQGVSLREVTLSSLGSAKSIEVLKNNTTIAGGRGDMEQVEQRIELLKSELEQTDELYECERVQERITRLASGVAVISVGAPTEIEMIEKKHRIEDALEAVRSAQQEGVVPGGGVALLRAALDLDVPVANEAQRVGVEVVKGAVRAPIRQMAVNAGASPDLILSALGDKATPACFGYNFATSEIVDMYEEGIIDPVKVTKSALTNAASAASILLTTNHAIVQVD